MPPSSPPPPALTPPAAPPSSTPALAGPIVLDIAGGDALPAAGTNQPLYGVLGFSLLALALTLRFNRFARSRA